MLSENTISNIEAELPDKIELLKVEDNELLFSIEGGLNRGQFINKIDNLMKELHLFGKNNFLIKNNSIRSSSSDSEDIIYEVSIISL